MVIFRGKGLGITKVEKDKWDKRIHVRFQPVAWCNEEIMIDWTRTQWGNYLTNPPTPGSTGKVLIADVHRAQQTENVKTLLARTKTALVNILGG